MATDKLKFLNDYLKTYFDEMLIKDIRLIKDKNLHFTYPYVLLVSAGIDFLGGLEEGFKDNNSKQRSKHFIENWMGQFNSLYKHTEISTILYVVCRCGASHEGIYKPGIEVSSWSYRRDKHLHHVIDFQGKDKIFIHAFQLLDDFMTAKKLYRTHLKTNYETPYKNLIDLLSQKPKPEVLDAINYLKDQGLSFDANKEASENPEVEDFDPTTYRIKRADGLEATITASNEDPLTITPPNSRLNSTSTSKFTPLSGTVTQLPDLEEFENEK